MAQLALGLAGAYVGSFFGPIGASIGWSIGAAIGGTFEPNKQTYGPRLDDLHLAGSSYGAFITRGWGTYRTACNVIDQTPLTETEHTSGGGKGGGGGVEVHSFTYSASVDAAICEGPVGEVRKIWANGRLIFDTTQDSTVDSSGVPVTFYLGTESQDADPTFEAEHGAGNVPAYRGICHAVFANWELGPFGNVLPQLNFEVSNHICNPGIDDLRSREDLPMTWGGREASAHFDRRYGPRIIAWPLTGEIHIQQHGTHGGDTYLDAVTLDVISAHLTATEDSATADVGTDTVGAWYYCGTMHDDTAIWLSRQYIVHDRSAMTGTDLLTNPAISPSPPSQVGSIAIGGEDLAEQWGIPIGECPVNLTISANGRMAFVMTVSTPTTVGTGLGTRMSGANTIDKWYKIIDGAIVAQGTLSGTIHEFAGCQSHPNVGNITSCASFENNYRYMWAVSSNDSLVHVYSIGEDNVFAIDAATAAATLELWPASSGGYPIAGGAGTRFGIPDDPVDATPTADDPAEWAAPEAGNPAISIMASSSDGYAGVAIYATVNTMTRCHTTEDATTLDIIVGDLCQIVKDAEEAITGQTSTFSWDVTDLEGIVVIGFVLTQQMTARAAIEALMAVYFFDGVESDGEVRFVLRGHASIATISDDDLAAHTDGEDIPALLTCVRRQEQDLPATMSLTYMEFDRDYQVGAQTSRRMIGGSAEVVTVQAPVVFRAFEAKQRVDALLFSAWYERESYSWQTTRKYVYLEPNDVVTVGSAAKVLRITRKTERADGVVQFEGVPSFGPMFAQTGSGGSGGNGFPEQEPPVAQLTDLVLLDVPIVDPAFGPSVAVYYPAMAGALRRSWLGASLQRSLDGGINYTEIVADTLPETIGLTTTALGAWHGGNIFDETNSVTVALKLGAGTLESVTHDAVRLGANKAVIGSEVLQFRTATLIAERTYVLTGLRRGRHGSEWAMATHAEDENFVLLPVDPSVVVATAGINVAAKYKAVTFGSNIDSATEQDFTYTGVVLKPYAPAYPVAGITAGGDFLLAWIRRTRWGGEWIDFVDVPLNEPSELYWVTIYDDEFGSHVMRVITATTPSATYTAAQQTTDFGSPQSDLHWTVQQVGALGPGYAAAVNVSPP